MRYFTVQEANGFIPALEQAFRKIDRNQQAITRLLAELQALGHPLAPGTTEVAEDLPDEARRIQLRVLGLVKRIRGALEDFQAHGLVVRRLDGLVDFCSLRGDRPVLLCWRKGERRIDHWHEVGLGFDERRRVDRLFKPTLAN